MSNQFWWFTARASGTAAWVSISLSIIVGMLTTTRATGRLHRRLWLVDVHRTLGGVGSSLVGLHIVAVIADTYEQFSITDTLIPFASTWRPTAVAWGIVGLYVLIAVEVTSLIQRRLSHGVWRRIHDAGFIVFWLLTAHGFYAGTDADHLAARATGILLSAIIAPLTVRRIRDRFNRTLMVRQEAS